MKTHKELIKKIEQALAEPVPSLIWPLMTGEAKTMMDEDEIEPAVEALFGIEGAIRSAGREIGKEGAEGMGAIEALGLMLQEGCSAIAGALSDIAEALREEK